MVSIDPPSSDTSNPAATSALDGKRILLLSAYDAASHKYWRQQLVTMFPRCHWTELVLPARYFSWRIRGNSLSWAFNHRQKLTDNYDLLIATSVCDLASLRGFVPELARIPALVYFHENQLAYPDSGKQHPSVEPAMVNLYAALCADLVAFNSEWNRRSFLDGLGALLKRLPDEVPRGVVEMLASRSVVLPVPLSNELFGESEFLIRDPGGTLSGSDTPWTPPWGLASPIHGLRRSDSLRVPPVPLALRSDVEVASFQASGHRLAHSAESGLPNSGQAEEQLQPECGQMSTPPTDGLSPAAASTGYGVISAAGPIDVGCDVGLVGDAADRRSPRMGDASPQGRVHGVSAATPTNPAALEPISIVWNHRHEHDKGPDLLLAVTQALITRNLRFQLHLLGQRFRQRPAAFETLEQLLHNYYTAQGIEPGINRFIEDRQQYEAILRSADMVLSTADHDFQGLSMLEAAALGCIAIAPDALAYPEYLPAQGLYPVENLSLEQQAQAAADLIERVARNLTGERVVPDSVRALKATNLAPRWQDCLQALAKR